MAKALAVADPQAEKDPKSVTRITAGPERLLLFLKDVREEMRKVVTPTREQVISTTIVVLVTVFIFAAYFGLVDFTLGKAIDWFFKHFSRH